MGKVISIFQVKEGLYQTILCLNLAISLAKQTKENCVIIDLSFSGKNEFSTLMDYKPDKSILDIVPLLRKLDSKLIKGYISSHSSGISIITGIENQKKSLLEAGTIAELIFLIASVYPFTLITTSFDYDNQLISILESSDLALLTVSPNLLSLSHANTLLDALKLWHFPLSIVKPVLNKPQKYDMDIKYVEGHLGMQIFHELAYDKDAINISINESKPIVLLWPNNKFSVDINSLAKKMLSSETYSGIVKREKMISNEAILSGGADVNTIGSSNSSIDYIELKQKIHKKLISKLDLKNTDLENLADKHKMEEVKDKTRKIIQDLLANEKKDLSREERYNLVEEMINEVLGLGCLEQFLNNPDITEIMVNGPNDIFVEKKGKIHYTGERFSSEEQLRVIIDRIVSPIGRRVDESSPLVDARLSDGSRVNIIIPPLSLMGPAITIRKFSKKKLIADDLIGFGALTKQMAEFLEMCVKLRKNIVISGGTGSGKTTLLNVTSGFIPEDERIVTIEDSAELKLPQKHVISLESRPPSIEGTGEISIRRLVINALRMRPDRIVVGECRGGETLDMLQAMNTGHDGSLTTIHANSPKDGISRIATMAIMSGTELPDKAIKEQIASAVQVIVQLNRLSDGSRKITEISEITGIKDNEIMLSSIFKFEQTGVSDGKVLGNFISTGNIPTFIVQVETHGLRIDKNIFNKGKLL
ncbi:MAG: Flp pilus assembly complex ATPase component TadA [Elusimicrobia bacterium]|nr:Flp pilus assembly complex ATPase component TadA [Candidatus Liberimonas magnetica]